MKYSTGCAAATTLLLFALSAEAQVPATYLESSIDEILVDGAYPGPPMWKVTRDDDTQGHVIWIVADMNLLPRKLQWKSLEIQKTVQESDEILLLPMIDVQPEGEMSIRTGFSLLRSAVGMRKNPNAGLLKDSLPTELYEDWLEQKKLYLARNRSVERFRPIFAIRKLTRSALDKLQLREEGAIWERLSKTVDDHKIKTTRPLITFQVSPETLKESLQQLSRENLSDQECFATSLSLIGAISDKPLMRARARAWATGDLLALSVLDRLPDPAIPCMSVLFNSTVSKRIFPSDLGSQFVATWLNEVERSLASNRSTVAILPLSQLLQPDGWLSTLRARGYIVTAQ